VAVTPTPILTLTRCEPLLVGKTQVVAMQGMALFKLRITSLSSHRDKQRFRIRVSPVDTSLLLREPHLTAVTTPMKCVTKLSHRGGGGNKEGEGEEARPAPATRPALPCPALPCPVLPRPAPPCSPCSPCPARLASPSARASGAAPVTTLDALRSLSAPPRLTGAPCSLWQAMGENGQGMEMDPSGGMKRKRDDLEPMLEAQGQKLQELHQINVQILEQLKNIKQQLNARQLDCKGEQP